LGETNALFLRGKPLASLVKGTQAHDVFCPRLKGEGPHGASPDAARITAAEITNQRALLTQLDRAHGAKALANTAACAEFRINLNLASRADPDGLYGALCAVPLQAALANDGIVEALVFDFDHLDAAGAPPHSP